MSVAFRRESDEEHLEPKFELPIPPGSNFVTPTGLAQIEACVVALERLELLLAAPGRDLCFEHGDARLDQREPVRRDIIRAGRDRQLELGLEMLLVAVTAEGDAHCGLLRQIWSSAIPAKF
jgi:hypothetical protein